MFPAGALGRRERRLAFTEGDEDQLDRILELRTFIDRDERPVPKKAAFKACRGFLCARAEVAKYGSSRSGDFSSIAERLAASIPFPGPGVDSPGSKIR